MLFASVKTIVLVHGAWVDGSGWKPVYDILVKDGYRVTTVQEPLNVKRFFGNLATEVDDSVLRLLGARTLADALLEIRSLDAERV